MRRPDLIRPPVRRPPSAQCPLHFLPRPPFGAVPQGLSVHAVQLPRVYCNPFLFSEQRVPNGQFVIIAAFDQTGTHLAVEERVGLALKRSGMSVTCKW